MSAPRREPTGRAPELLALYDHALPEVFGYLASRCGSDSVAEDLTSETFLAAADATRRGTVPDLTVAWLIGVARHKLVDHWRRREREDRAFRAASDPDAEPEVPVIPLPERKTAMPSSTTAPPATSTALTATAVTPYLAVSDGEGALDWYHRAFGAEEQFRVVGHDGRLGHAEFTIGAARFMVSDEYPEVGVLSPTIGGAGTALHLSVGDVDALFAQAVDAGATPQSPPADQPHGARAGTLVDPFGHRWMLSQQLEAFDLDTYRDRSAGSGFEVIGAGLDEEVTVADRPGTGGGIWAGAFYEDALAGIRFLVDVLGFEEQLVVTGADHRTVVHSQLRWPEGGVVQVGTYDPANEFTHEPGGQALYVVTGDPAAVWERCRSAGVTVVREPVEPDYDPGGMGFSIRDPEGNIWSFGSYGLGPS